MSTTETLQVKFDQDLARDLQINPEVQKLGVPEFVQRAVRFYLRRSEELEIRPQYQKGYGGADLTDLELEMKDWEKESRHGQNHEAQSHLLYDFKKPNKTRPVVIIGRDDVIPLLSTVIDCADSFSHPRSAA